MHVRIKVDEGVPWHLSKVDLKGVKKVPEAELRKVMNLKVGAPYVKEDVEKARESVIALYYDRGFVAMHLELESPPPNDKGDAPVTFAVDEGDAYTVRALHITGSGASSEKELLDKVMKSKPHQVMNRSQLMGDVGRIKDFFSAKNQDVSVQPQTEIDPKAHLVDITFDVNPNQ